MRRIPARPPPCPGHHGHRQQRHRRGAEAPREPVAHREERRASGARGRRRGGGKPRGLGRNAPGQKTQLRLFWEKLPIFLGGGSEKALKCGWGLTCGWNLNDLSKEWDKRLEAWGLWLGQSFLCFGVPPTAAVSVFVAHGTVKLVRLRGARFHVALW